MKLRSAVWAVILLCALGAALKLDRRACFIGDGLGKLVQSVSLRQNAFVSDQLHYPGASAVYLLLIRVFDLFAHPHPLVLLAMALGTPLLLLSLEFSENIYAVLLGGCGSGFLLSAHSSADFRPGRLAASGFLLALAVFLRLEAALLLAAYSAAMIYDTSRRSGVRSAVREYIPFGVSAAAVLLILFALNLSLYGNIMGPRMIANPTDERQTALLKLQVLLFGGQAQLGFFGYMPGLLFLLFFVRSIWYDRAVRIAAIAIVLFLPIVPVLAPHTGVVNWGPRFLIHAVFPCLYLLARWFETASPRWQKIVVMALFVPSLAFTAAGYHIERIACKQLRAVQTEFVSAGADVWIFSDPLLASNMGVEYFARPAFLARSEAEIRDLSSALKQTHPGRKAVYFSPQVPDEWRAMMPPEIVHRKDYGQRWSEHLSRTDEKSSRFSKALLLQIP